MYNTHLILPPEINAFDINSLSSFEYYVFVLVPSAADFELALTKFGPVLAACDALCFLIDQEHLIDMEANVLLNSLFKATASTTPVGAVSFISTISKNELLGPNEPKGTWFELFLSLEKTVEDREKKLRFAIQEALSTKPKNYSAYGPTVARLAEWLVRTLLKAHL